MDNMRLSNLPCQRYTNSTGTSKELLPVTEATILKLFPVHFIKRYILSISVYFSYIYIYFLHLWKDMRTVALYFKGILDSIRNQPAAEFHQCIYVNNEEMDILFGLTTRDHSRFLCAIFCTRRCCYTIVKNFTNHLNGLKTSQNICVSFKIQMKTEEAINAPKVIGTILNVVLCK